MSGHRVNDVPTHNKSGDGGIRTPGPVLPRPFISSEVQSATLARLHIALTKGNIP